ncbi:respirasome Complex Assembly Factor 1-like [Xenia sp. Carnegie-2017]|uniref:respirasome Complex Assembly Factor 1-like n=1 Tax=Xenia sp. Carnegie-2017 TaxID=2897299 RepID=UPI001F040510|nr:respirasome Complex Assembly Factor 1-like [Xenia sp. Carnegie-2017]
MNVHKRKKNVEVEIEPSIWSKAFSAGSNWNDKDEFLDVIYWLRQVLAIVLGLIWAIIPLKGIAGIVLFGLINAGALFVYFTNFQKIDDEEYGGPMELTKEGFFTSLSLF